MKLLEEFSRIFVLLCIELGAKPHLMGTYTLFNHLIETDERLRVSIFIIS